MRSSASLDSINEYRNNKELISRVIVDLQDVMLKILSDNSNCRFPLYYPQSFEEGNSKDVKMRSSSRGKTREKDLTGLNVLQILTSPTKNSSSRFEQSNWLSSLDESSASKLLVGKLNESLDFLARLHSRVSDSHSRVLITGDVNSGKSSLINALIQSEILPVDQQPCTQAFAEITLDTVTQRNSNQQVIIHGVADICEYDCNQPNSFKLFGAEEFNKNIQEDPSPYPWYKLYISRSVNDERYARLLTHTSLIDSPGLNSDSYKTMALFAQQEDIDVVVFVLNAANHITLSARDFLEAAGLDKADNIFIIVNKYDEIKNKEKCTRIIMQQINEIFPKIDKDSFIFFTSSRCGPADGYSSSSPADSMIQDRFKRFEEFLIEFLISKKSRSKLMPAVNYMQSLLKELSILMGHNLTLSLSEAEKTEEEIKIITPAYENMLRRESELLLKLEDDNTKCCNSIYSHTKTSLEGFNHGLCEFLKTQKWLGILRIWTYRTEVIKAVENKCRYELDICKRLALQRILEATREMKLYSNFSKDAKEEDIVLATVSSIPILALQRWDMINFKYEISRYKTVLGASSAVAAVLGYQPAINISIKVGELLTQSNYSRYIIFGSLALGVMIGLRFIDIEGMIRRHLESILSSAYGEEFTHENSRKIENDCHGILSSVQSQIMHNFYECVTRQRKLKAEKDVYKAQMRARIEHFTHISEKLDQLRDKLNAVEL